MEVEKKKAVPCGIAMIEISRFVCGYPHKIGYRLLFIGLLIFVMYTYLWSQHMTTHIASGQSGTDTLTIRQNSPNEVIINNSLILHGVSEITYHQRLSTVDEACDQIGSQNKEGFMCNWTNEPKTLFYLPRQRLIFCTAAKVASTFWTNKLNQSGELREVVAKSSDIFKEFHTYHKVMFSRDPYSRLLSAYIDKFLAPNHQYWKLGRYIAQKRENASKTSRECGHDVTFREFIREVVLRSGELQKVDIHWRPVYRHCCPCQVSYDFIGHFETMSEDKSYVMDKLKIHENPDISGDNTKRRVLRQVKNTIDRTKLSWLVKCVTTYEGLARTLLKQQIEGIFRSDLTIGHLFPLHDRRLANLTQSDAELAFSREFDTNGLKSSDRMYQRHRALVEIYRTVPLADLVEVRQLYERDFRLFGYDPNPADIFNREQTIKREFVKPPIIPV